MSSPDGERLARMEGSLEHLHDCLHRIEKTICDETNGDLPKLKRRVTALEKFKDRELTILAVLVIVINILTGTGVFTLTTLIHTLKGAP